MQCVTVQSSYFQMKLGTFKALKLNGLDLERIKLTCSKPCPVKCDRTMGFKMFTRSVLKLDWFSLVFSITASINKVRVSAAFVERLD